MRVVVTCSELFCPSNQVLAHLLRVVFQQEEVQMLRFCGLSAGRVKMESCVLLSPFHPTGEVASPWSPLGFRFLPIVLNCLQPSLPFPRPDLVSA